MRVSSCSPWRSRWPPGFSSALSPAIQARSANLNAALAEGGRGGTTGRAGRAHAQRLVVSEVALAVLVLIGAGLLMRSFVRLRSVDLGFRRRAAC